MFYFVMYRGTCLISRQRWRMECSIARLRLVIPSAQEVERRLLANTSSWSPPDPPVKVCAWMRVTCFIVGRLLLQSSALLFVGNIQVHSNTYVSQSKANLLSPAVVSAGEEYPAIVKAHGEYFMTRWLCVTSSPLWSWWCYSRPGALMLIAWMTTGSVGMLIARYLKAVGRGKGCCGKDFWFLVSFCFL